jgi:hypothetical protein
LFTDLSTHTSERNRYPRLRRVANDEETRRRVGEIVESIWDCRVMRSRERRDGGGDARERERGRGADGVAGGRLEAFNRIATGDAFIRVVPQAVKSTGGARGISADVRVIGHVGAVGVQYGERVGCQNFAIRGGARFLARGLSAGASEARTDEVARTEKTEASSRAKGKARSVIYLLGVCLPDAREAGWRVFIKYKYK